jgi:hypothetical protein
MRLMLRFELVAVVLLGAGVGCVRHGPAAVAPHQGELLTLEKPEQIVPASIGVEGRGEEARVRLVPDFKEPELTPEEKAAIGVRPDPVNWLEFYEPRPDVMRVLPDLGGGAIAIAGWGGAGVRLDAVRRVAAQSTARKAVAEEHSERTGVSEAAPDRRPPGGAVSSDRGGVRTGECEERRAAGRRTRADR